MKKIELICPKCKYTLILELKTYKCPKCEIEYPIVNNVPILLLIDDQVFNHNTCADPASSGFYIGFRQKISRYLPDLTLNKFQEQALCRFISYLRPGSSGLIIGAGNDKFLKARLLAAKIDVKAIDVFVSSDLDYVCDATCLPFADNQFDAVFIIAVLEHVIDPQLAVREISRVLRVDGKVFSAIPFMQQVHMDAFDFQRYTLLGHRWLYSSFEMLELAATSGAGSALAWSISSFFQSFFSRVWIKLLFKALIRIFLFWIKYFDLLQSSYSDYALGTYFIGINKKQKVINCRQLIDLYPHVR